MMKNFLLESILYFKSFDNDEPFFWSWCSWTTFTRLSIDAGYWTAPLPLVHELLEDQTADGGMWTQPFFYDEIAHIILPKTFTFSKLFDSREKRLEKEQNISGLYRILKEKNLDVSLSEFALDYKLF